MVLPELKSFVGNATLIVADSGRWRRFLRAELRAIKRHGAGRLLNELVDVGYWAHQRFPRQRRNVAAIARRLGIEFDKELVGLEREAELLRLIALEMNTSKTLDSAGISGSDRDVRPKVPGVAEDPMVPKAMCLPQRNGWMEQLGHFWRRLSGKM
jgi:hypothetical protein